MNDCEAYFFMCLEDLYRQWKDGEYAKKENERPAANESAQTPKGNIYDTTRDKRFCA